MILPSQPSLLSVHSVTQSCPILCDPIDCSTPGFPVHHQLPELAQTYVQSRWCHSSISSSVIPFSSCLQSFPASGSFLMSQLLASGGQSIGTSAKSFQWIFRIDFLWDWLVWSPCSLKDSQKVFSNTTVQKHQFFGAQPSLWSNSHIHKRLLEKL